MQYPSVYVIILNYNSIDHLTTTLNCFFEQTYSNLHIVVVDNGSTFEIQEKIKAFKNIHFIFNTINKGWAGGNNIGIRYGLEKNADYILLANNDIVFEDKRLVETIVKQAESLSPLNILVHGTLVYDYYEPNEKPNAGLKFLSFKKAIEFNKIRIAFEHINQIPEDVKIVDSVHGCFMLLHKNVLLNTAYFDESMFLYHEELEFSNRLWMNGIASAVHTNLSIFHKIATTTGQNSAKHLYYLNRNILYLYSKKIRNIGFSNKVNLYFQFFKTYFNIMFRKKAKQYKDSRWRLICALSKAIFDGVFNRMGERYS